MGQQLQGFASGNFKLYRTIIKNVQNDPDLAEGTFKVINNHGAILALNWVDRDVVFTPVDKVRIWFGLCDLTGTIFLDIVGPYIDVNFGQETTAKIFYDQSGTWSVVD
ncbi:hypothetical protein GYMLUDRAFT_247724 [Collybiopsis luxurians FD-317 M1]|uniref:Uncharacterized protein n=1 Tax=Collybiopsis luxurians FD-317 M1 TaxID=944289 RepID=A0A0D0BNV0_9AGAR|nr:hypothetical protein GYMLUDRAFT_247724 [Collybiopsis luxurians FD-317 M1]